MYGVFIIINLRSIVFAFNSLRLTKNAAHTSTVKIANNMTLSPGIAIPGTYIAKSPPNSPKKVVSPLLHSTPSRVQKSQPTAQTHLSRPQILPAFYDTRLYPSAFDQAQLEQILQLACCIRTKGEQSGDAHGDCWYCDGSGVLEEKKDEAYQSPEDLQASEGISS